ncbi:MAG: ATP-binding protein [Burkholderiaceae bacterium]
MQLAFDTIEPAQPPEQFRMRRLQVYNWGTFAGVHDVPIAERGFLFVGRSGAGKSTLLDAISALLVPPRWIDFNAAAREAERSGRDRNLVSYVRGAWAEQKDDASGEIATRFLRTGTTWTAIALTFDNGRGRTVVLAQLLWLRGAANGAADVHRQFMVFERALEITEFEAFGQANLDVRKLKLQFPDAFVRGEFRPYSERFCRLLGIENELSLRLLHKTQSAKNLGDLNAFMREFMLERPATFDAADRLVAEFDELNAAHQAVVSARQQVEALLPARVAMAERERLQASRLHCEALSGAVDTHRSGHKARLLGERIAALQLQADALHGEIGRAQADHDREQDELRALQRRHDAAGGDQISAWRNEHTMLERQRDDRLRMRSQAAAALTALDVPMPDSPRAWAQAVAAARAELEDYEGSERRERDARDKLVLARREAESAFEETVAEVQALERQPSNIPAQLLALRARVAAGIGLDEGALPFVGELLQVRADAAEWQGAIERVLHGFGLSILVDDRHYAAMSSFVEGEHLGQRLVYYRVAPRESTPARTLTADSLVFKLEIKPGSQGEWLARELRERFDYTCVTSLQAFRRADRALTVHGQIRHSRTRHEKDDRRALDDRRPLGSGLRQSREAGSFQTPGPTAWRSHRRGAASARIPGSQPESAGAASAIARPWSICSGVTSMRRPCWRRSVRSRSASPRPLRATTNCAISPPASPGRRCRSSAWPPPCGARPSTTRRRTRTPISFARHWRHCMTSRRPNSAMRCVRNSIVALRPRTGR